MQKFDIIIVGSGPAGTTAALELRHSGLRVAMLDQADFPRDKVCGDAIPGPAFRLLERMSDELGEAIHKVERKEDVTSCRLYAPDGGHVKIFWKTTAYNAPRLNFDEQLFRLVQRHTATTFFAHQRVERAFAQNGAVHLHCREGQQFSAPIVLGCDGARSVISRQLSDYATRKDHQCAAVRLYCRNVAGVELGCNEFHYLRDYLPGYFWIFPVGNGVCNVGFGMLAKTQEARRINLRQTLDSILTTHPVLTPRFAKAERLDSIRGFGLPLGMERSAISGDHFMLCGDAASLVDPLQGHGIDKAMISGQLAAQRAMAAHAAGDFSAAFLADYDRQVYQKVWKTFRQNRQLMRLLTAQPWLVNWGIRIAQQPFIRQKLQKLITG